MAHEIWLLVHRALKRARNAFNGICPRLTFNVTSPWRRCGPSIRASWCIVDLDEEDKGDEADEHQQYCVLKAVFEVACCHLATDYSCEECFDHGHVEEDCCDLGEWEADEAEAYSSY